NKADVWLRVRPGTDAALALGIAHVMLDQGWYDRAFVRDWTNGPLLVRGDDGRLLTARDLPGAGEATRYVVRDERTGRPALYDPATGGYDERGVEPALEGEVVVETAAGPVTCRPAFDLMAEACARYPPARVEAVCGVPAARVEEAARLLWEA